MKIRSAGALAAALALSATLAACGGSNSTSNSQQAGGTLVIDNAFQLKTADPGRMFDWISFFVACYPDHPMPAREPICPLELQAGFKKIVDALPEAALPAESGAAIRFWHGISATMETSVRLMQTNAS